MFRFKRLKEFKLSRRQCAYIMLYVLALVIVLVVIHEAAHILVAVVLGARFSDLSLGVLGINPSVTLPGWFTGTRQTVVHYAGGLAAGLALLIFYLAYWMRRYRHNPNFFTWSLGLITMMLSAMQFATGYLEGRYHTAYIIGAMSFLSPTDVLIYGWTISALFFHSSLCPWRRMKATVK